MFLSDVEAARMLRMPVSALKRSEVHRCSHGYHLDSLKEFCAEHGLPLGDWYNVLALKDKEAPLDDDRVVWCDSIEEMLWRANKFTKALIIPSELPSLWEFITKTGSMRLIVVGQSSCCHLSIDSWSKAIEVGCQKI